ncbi:ABC multidrug transporter B [Cladobotryum mycophilum]|uniref:ABC multidrug transporter B n=1 Tax=Cladobotryum mycophilum TaxID=491253 RepID=A0ABR0SAM7_9HYPO
MHCPPGADRSFGPQVDSRCRGFDFTLQFQDIFFVCVPSAVFIFLSVWQTLNLLGKPAAFSTRSRTLRASKLITFTLLLASQVAFLLRRVHNHALKTHVSLAADVLASIATAAATALSMVTHKRSLRPSTLLGLYLPFSLILGISRTRTLWLLDKGSREAALMTVALGLTLLAFILESIEERKGLNLGAPEEFSGIWTRTAFTWLVPTLRRGYARIISLDDLPSLDRKLESRVLHRQIVFAWSKYDHRGWHSLLRASFRGYFTSFLSAVVPRLCVTAFTFAQPFLINTTIKFIGQKHPDLNHGKGLVAAWAIVYVGLAVSHSVYKYQTSRFISRVRGGLIALVYQRCLEVRAVDAGDITAVTLMGTDIDRIASSLRGLHETWGALLDICIACWLLERQLFLACLAPIVLVVIFVGETSQISLSSRKAQREWIESVQERLRATSTMLGDIKAIKMLGLSRVTSNILTKLRVNEVNTSKSFRKLLIATVILSLSPITLAPVVTFAIYVLMSVYWIHGSLLTAQAFTSLALITLLTTPVIIFIQVMPMVVQSVSSFDRIQEYCNYTSDPIGDGRGKSGLVELRAESEINLLAEDDDAESSILPASHVIALHNQSFGWDKTSPPVLKNIEVVIKEEIITAIIGPVGSGKSALLNSMLGEMVSKSALSRPSTAVQKATEQMAYCSQEPWLENATIRHNITSISPYNKKWYDEVVASCGLDADLKQLPRGDQTRIGSRGLNLSGGQKQRIALARAVYSKRRIAILDDVFSGMDAHTTDVVASRLIGRDGLFRKLHMTVVLATHNRKIMALSDEMIVLEDGKITAHDSPAKLLKNNGYVGKIGLQLLFDGNGAEEVPEMQAVSETQGRFDMAADAAVEMAEELDDKHTDMRRKKGELSVYAFYLRNSGWASVILYTIAVTGWVVCMEFSTIWIKWWSAANTAEPNKDVWMYLGIYALLGIVSSLSGLVAAWVAFMPIISRSAMQLHSILLEATLRAPFRYFAATDIGELINRFSRDMELIDMELPRNLVNYTSTVVSCIAKVVILAVFSKYLGVTIPLFAIVVYFLQSFYLQTSRQVRLLVIEAQAPLFTHFGESVSGAATIRAFGWKSYHQERNYRLTDASQRPVYLQSCIQSWLSFVLELMVAVLAVLLVGTVLIWRDKFSPGSVGVSLVTVVGFSEVLVRLLETWTTLEPSIGAVARVKHFATETESEERKEKGAYVAASWPQAGAVEFSNLVAAYDTKPDSKPVLKNVSLSIQAGQHVAVCGRTGSGKTSLILSLLQMIDTVEGTITIDRVDLSTLPCREVRSHINVVPQDPLLIPGTVRFNIDPYSASWDDEIIRVLERVKLWGIVQEQGGLDKEIDTSAWSVGQKQLVCFARAMVRRCKLLILDEAMSSVDSETEAIMQDIIDTEFKGCTVISVIHRLEHIRSYDKAALFGNGKLLEFDDPKKLMSEKSQLAELHRLHDH